MDKIFRRTTQSDGKPRKKKNEKNRVRNTIINFRVTPTEKELIEARIALTGLPKAQFFIESCLYQTVLVKGNVKTFSEIKKKMAEISVAIEKNPYPAELTPELRESLQTILEILDRLFGKD